MKIIAFAGKKQSGKDSCARFLSHQRNATLFFGNNCSIVYVPFAGPMKEFCVEYLNISENLVYGSDVEKNKLTHIRWEKLPYYDKLPHKKKGFMTVRELLQQVGEDMFVPFYPYIWLDKYGQRVNQWDGQDVIVLTPDIRKPEQVRAVQSMGGKVIHLLRDPYQGSDRHVSETALDGYEGFDAEIDNRMMDVKGTNKWLLGCLVALGCVPPEVWKSQKLIVWEPK